jgi:hypothetical protein
MLGMMTLTSGEWDLLNDWVVSMRLSAIRSLKAKFGQRMIQQQSNEKKVGTMEGITSIKKEEAK